MVVLQDLGIIEVPVERLVVNQELKRGNLVRTKDERQALKDQILAEKILRDPFCLWVYQGQNLIVDGFNRYEIVLEINQEASQQDLPIPFPRVKAYMMEFESMDEALYWITINQNARRSLTDIQKTYMMGNLYHSLKTTQQVMSYLSALGKTDNQQLQESLKDVSKRNEILAIHFNVNEKTIRRAASFAEGFNRIAKKAKEASDNILRGEPINGTVWSQKMVEAIGAIDEGTFKKHQWNDLDQLGILLKRKTEDKAEKQLEIVRELKASMQQFIDSPSLQSAREHEQLMKRYLDLHNKSAMEAA